MHIQAGNIAKLSQLYYGQICLTLSLHHFIRTVLISILYINI
jgi:hypothetical protein